MITEQLLKACRQHNRIAQKHLFEEYADAMMLLCRRYVKNAETAEEVMHNGFLNFFKSLSRFKYVNEQATIAWLRKILVNECLQLLRQKNSFLHVAEEIHDHNVVHEEDIISRLSAEEIFKWIMELPVGYRTVFNLYVLEGMTHKEIACLLHISEGTSKSQLSKARNMMQQLFTKNHGYEGRKIR